MPIDGSIACESGVMIDDPITDCFADRGEIMSATVLTLSLTSASLCTFLDTLTINMF